MKQQFLPFALPEIGNDEIMEVISTLRSGWITTGPKVKQFEDEFSLLFGDGIKAVAVNSATAGLHLALEALGIGAGDEVITTTHTFTATAEIIRYLGATPVFVDIDERTLCIDVSKVELAITARTKAIIPVHFGGKAADMVELLKLSKKHNLRIVEDAAHAFPTTCDNKLVGTLESDVTVFSFYSNKTMTTGEGGMLVTRNLEIATRSKIMRLHGINRDVFDRFVSQVPSWYYEVVAPGFKYNMTDIAAAIGIHQLKRVYDFHKKRCRIASLYNDAFYNLPVILPPQASAGEVHSWHLYVIQLGNDVHISRNNFIERMFAKGIGCSVHYIPLHLHPYWRDSYKLTPDMYPVSQKVYDKCISLPIYSCMTDTDVERVISAVKEELS